MGYGYSDNGAGLKSGAYMVDRGAVLYLGRLLEGKLLGKSVEVQI